MARACYNCQGTDIEYDNTQGNSVCTQCGAVLEENTIVSEVTFLETAGGSILQGQFVSDKGIPTSSLGGMHRRFLPADSREWTIANARAKIQSVAYAVQLSDHHIDSAQRWFTLCLQHNFTRGRKTQNIAAACLYIVCRQEKTSHMLLDFSDVLQTNVFELGNIFLKVCRLLNLELPLVDPSLYIARFASKLEFGDKTNLVANTALRLVSRMARDWIQTGRRPSGICGACLLISARMYGFKRTQKEIINVVRVCDMTLRKRLDEFGETPSSKLTPEEFHGIWLEQEADPPAYSQNKLKQIQDSKNKTIEVGLKQQEQGEALLEKLVKEIEPLDSDFNMETIFSALETDNEKLLGILNELNQNLEYMDNDHEIVNAFLDKDERELKSAIWMEENKDYLETQEEKLRLKKEMEAQGYTKPPPKKRKKRELAVKISTEPAATASEAARNLIQQNKKLSKKFNYDVLDLLLDSNPIRNLAGEIDKATKVM